MLIGLLVLNFIAILLKFWSLLKDIKSTKIRHDNLQKRVELKRQKYIESRNGGKEKEDL